MCGIIRERAAHFNLGLAMRVAPFNHEWREWTNITNLEEAIKHSCHSHIRAIRDKNTSG
jgi:hypothetical protein